MKDAIQKDLVQKKLIQEFSALSSWEAKYERIIALGKAMPALDDKFKIDDLKVRGCQSQVWLRAQLDDMKRVHFEADSDALIVKGLIAILLQVYSGRTAKEILDISPDFIAELGFEKNLSPSRANGLMAMVKQIKYYALVFSNI
jgi:cysteine desulfuration protein SufE